MTLDPGTDQEEGKEKLGGHSARTPLARFLVFALFSILPTVLLVLGVEGVARFGWPDMARTHRDMMVEPDDGLLWRLVPQASGPFATNELGFRDDPPNQEAGRRVLVVGDSVTWGHGVRTRDALYTIRLESLLGEARPELRIGVASAALPGYSTFREVALVEQLAPRLQPDALVLQFCLNDVVARYRRLRQFGGQDVFLGVDTRRGTPGLHGLLVRRSRAFDLLVSYVSRRNHDATAYEVQDLTAEPLPPHLDAACQRTQAELEALVEWHRRRGVPLLPRVVPYRLRLEDPDGLDAPEGRLRAYAASRGIQMVGVLLDLARAEAAGVGATFLDKSHLLAAGHAVVARRLVAPVLSLLEGSPRRAGAGAALP